MRMLPPAILFLATCNSSVSTSQTGGSGPAADGILQDMMSTVDMADMSKVDPPDLTPPCELPGPGFYYEYTGYTFSPIVGGSPQLTSNQQIATISTSHAISRPPQSQFSTSSWRCENIQPDPATCQAKCCAGDALEVPLLQYSDGNVISGTKGGWRMIKAGRCKFSDPTTGLGWIADVQMVVGSPQ